MGPHAAAAVGAVSDQVQAGLGGGRRGGGDGGRIEGVVVILGR